MVPLIAAARQERPTFLVRDEGGTFLAEFEVLPLQLLEFPAEVVACFDDQRDDVAGIFLVIFLEELIITGDDPFHHGQGLVASIGPVS